MFYSHKLILDWNVAGACVRPRPVKFCNGFPPQIRHTHAFDQPTCVPAPAWVEFNADRHVITTAWMCSHTRIQSHTHTHTHLHLHLLRYNSMQTCAWLTTAWMVSSRMLRKHGKRMTQRHCRIGTTPKCVCLYICVRIYIFICKRVYLCKRFKFKLCVRVYARTRVVQFGVQSKVRVCGLSRILTSPRNAVRELL